MSEGPIAGNVADAAADTGEPTQTETSEQSTGTPDALAGQGQSQQDGKINPAWNPLLQQLPESLHHIVTPHLSEWDKGVQQRFQQLNERYQPYDAFIENQIDPGVLEQALGLYHLLDTNPKAIYDALVQQGVGKEEAAEAAEAVAGQGQGEQQSEEFSGYENPEFDVMQHPEVQRMKQMLEHLAESQLSAYEQQVQAEADEEIDTEFAEVEKLAKQHGIPFSEKALARIMLADESLSAMDAFKVHVDELRQYAESVRSAGAPVVMDGGGVPSQQVNPSQMSPQQRRQFVAEALKRAAQQSG